MCHSALTQKQNAFRTFTFSLVCNAAVNDTAMKHGAVDASARVKFVQGRSRKTQSSGSSRRNLGDVILLRKQQHTKCMLSAHVTGFSILITVANNIHDSVA